MATNKVKTNLTMLTDFYELTMANGYFAKGYKDTICYFDMFFRRVPDGGGYAVMVIETDQDIPAEALRWLSRLEGVIKVTYLNAEQ